MPCSQTAFHRCAALHPGSPSRCAAQTSLSQFVELYEQSIDESERAALPAKRIHNILEHMT